MKLYGTTGLPMNFIGFLVVFLLSGLSAPMLAQPWSKGMLISTPQRYGVLRNNAEQYFKTKGTSKGSGYKPYKRWDNYWGSRTNAEGAFPPANVRQDEWNRYIAQAAIAPGIGGSSWTSLGPNSSTGGYAGIGRINRVAFHPTDVNTFFACTAGGGLWKTSNGGSSWANLTNSLSRLGTSDLVVDASNPNILYLATGDCDAGDTPSIGVLKSTDGGASWNPTGLTFNDGQYVYIYRLIRHSSNANILLAATSQGIYRTTNAGQSWNLTLSSSWIFDLEQKPGAPTTYFAGGYDTQARIYISTDEGSTWTVRSTITNAWRTAIAVTPANPNFVGVLAEKYSDDSFLGFYSSSDGGLNYTLRSSTPNILGWESNGSGGSGQGWYDLSLAIDPTNANTIYVGGINTWKSTNGGTNWTINTMWYPESQSVPTVHADKHDLAFQNNSSLFQCNDGGIYKTTNGGSSWTDLSNGMTISQMYRIGVSQADAKIIAGLQDNGTKLRSTTGTWTDVIGGDGMDCAINPSNANVLYGEYQSGGLQRSTNGGTSWTEIIPENGSAIGAWISPIVIDPNNNQTLYFGTNRAVYKSTNQGTAWTKITNTLTLANDVNHIAVAASNSNYIYFVTGTNNVKEIYRTTNGGTSWTKMTTPISDRVSWLSVNPTDPNLIYITFANYSSGNKVFRSSDGGSTWTNISGTLPNLPANCIVYQTGSNGALYLGMDAGIFYRDNSMSDWSLFNSDLPNVEIFELEIKYNTNKILAATYGRGLWESPLYSVQGPLLTVSPATQSVASTAGNFAATVTSSAAWSVSSNASWLTASSNAGSGNASVTVSHTANTGAQRTGILTFTSSGLSQTITVTQATAPSLSVTPTSQSVSTQAGSANISVTSNVAWSVSSNAAWLTISPNSGSNNGTVVANFSANTGAARTGTLTFTGGGITRTATIAQAASASLSVTPTTQSVAKTSGSFSITVSSNVSWTVSSNAAWLKTSASSGNNNRTITANYASNSGAARTGTLTFSGAGITQTVTVNQADGRNFWVSPETYAAPATAGSFSFNINLSSVSTWGISNNSNWLSLNRSSGTGNASITVTHSANTSSSRTGVITIISGIESRTVTITQAGNTAPVLSISPSTRSVANAAGSFVASVTANVPWTASSNASWLSIAPSSGTGNASVNLTHTANSGAERVGVVTLSGGGATTSITVTQAAVASLTVNPTSQSVPANAGSFSITVTANIGWTVSSNANWLTANPGSGSNNGTATANYSANTGVARTGTLTFSGAGITRTVTVSQAAPTANFLTVSPGSKTLAAGADTFQVIVSSNVAWSLVSSGTWMMPAGTNGNGNTTSVIYYQQNPNTVSRVDTLTYSGSGIVQKVVVRQNAGTGSSLDVSPSTINTTVAASSVLVNITSNGCWTVSDNASWVLPGATEGVGNASLSLFIQANSGVARSATVNIDGNDGIQTVVINQAAAASLIESELAFVPQNLQSSIQSASTIPKMDLFPNPAQDMVNIVLDAVDVEQQEVQLVVIDAYGREVIKQKVNGVSTKISLTNLSNGMYTFSMLLPNAKMLSKKLIVTKTE
ncbi:MAG: BACON domain-containing carbohydrate-binding protein [Haliscomenobacter sp.]|uniref:BACON domain-containing protein n=1 Tax=Haliscomenobacter sp. TaxID=2717303 RepID=UPI0029A41ECD|nr:BACON domain-containing carbohydrate-binding protein [Haliscomenobacter sp.]MDX2067516.1 BACON domain-containing carbohydrate-binding protein [Haliscomenobacter sp.]